ncbi:hypothetical protein [Turicibacter sanguinis]|uniref:hypothetical protein n=1 Tax=Turicibacter sanguinis TaxID=154288 RepID=UPI0018ABD7DF|nr:hypothetical protein [Turicibacter sanguinis]MDB8567717.1 hypothetical protein [Turicibacter sanguinis]MDB8570454.1 hypothetical protein [Turicibacter sanguinis]MDB8573223.1 hypothetical protein [Turicibacter sanguinis]MDB8581974.1 hypothetical protein [Turicibacter sanguinis]
MNKFTLTSELRGKYTLEELQQMELVAIANEDMTQDEIESVWDSGDGHYLLLVDEEDCDAVYNKTLA